MARQKVINFRSHTLIDFEGPVLYSAQAVITTGTCTGRLAARAR